MNDTQELKEALKEVDIVATDVDDTLTIDGILTSDVIRSIEYLNSTGRKVVLVTGRSGGACTTLAQYLPVETVIAENGGVIITARDIRTMDLPRDHRTRLHACFQDINRKYPGIREAQDNPFRLTDLSMDNRSIPAGAADDIRRIADTHGFAVTVSSVQTHLLPVGCSKAATLKSCTKGTTVITIGDSINDESLFDPALFPLSVGVANIRKYLGKLRYKPRWIMTQEQGRGFLEIVDMFRSVTYINT